MEPTPATGRERAHAETFGIEPWVFSRDVPETIQTLAPALRQFEEERGSDDEILEQFTSVYRPEKIKADLAEVHRREKAFEASDDRDARMNLLYATVLKLIVQDASHEWFPDCTIWRATKFDDYCRGTDLFMDIPGPGGEPLTLAVDVTCSRARTSQKLRDTMQEFRSGRFHTVEYFVSDTDDARARGRVSMPRVVLGASYHAITRAARVYGQWRRHAAVGSEYTKAEALERLRYSDIGGQLYEQLIHQVQVAYECIKELLDSTQDKNGTRADFLRMRGQYLFSVQRSLEERYRAWEKSRNTYIEHHKDIAPELAVPSNSVLDVIMHEA